MDSLRIVTLNLWNDRHKPERRLELIAEGLRALEPDMIALQEVRESPLVAQASTLAHMLGMYHAFGVVDPYSTGGPIGNAVLSRFPIEQADNLPLPSLPEDPRAALRTRTTTLAGTIQLTSVHLSWEPELSFQREKQVLALDELARAADGTTVVVAGDFNTAPEARCIRYFCGLDSLEGRGTFFRDAYARRHPGDAGFTWSSRNPCAVRWVEQNRRIDYVFVRGPVTRQGERTIEDSRIVLDTPGSDGVWPSDHFGVFAVIRLTPQALPHPNG